jgi:hypothetical protein
MIFYLTVSDPLVGMHFLQSVKERDLEPLIEADAGPREADEAVESSPLWVSIPPNPSKDLDA